MLIDNIRESLVLQSYLRDICEDEGICVDINPVISSKDYIIIKVDDFYNSIDPKFLGLEKTPPSPDCLIILKCADNNYSLTIVELRNVQSSKGFTVKEIKEKFETCLNDFMLIRFKEYFDYSYKKINLFFVNKIELHRASEYEDNRKARILINESLYFRDKELKIKFKMPTPAINPC